VYHFSGFFTALPEEEHRFRRDLASPGGIREVVFVGKAGAVLSLLSIVYLEVTGQLEVVWHAKWACAALLFYANYLYNFLERNITEQFEVGP
jgi:hypothetical protein